MPPNPALQRTWSSLTLGTRPLNASAVSRIKLVGMELVILIGLQGSGKSTFRRERLDATHAIVSKDLFRSNRRPQRRQMALVEEALTAGKSVVVDNTNPRRVDRQPLLDLGRRFGARTIGFFFSSRLEDSSRRNAARSGKERVPEVALRATAKVLELPSWAEGFDELNFVTISGENGFDIQAYVENQV